MLNQHQSTEENLIAIVRWDCRRQAEMAAAKLSEVLEALGDENHLGALGAFLGLDEEINSLKVFLARIAKLTVGEKPKLDS